MRGLKNRPASSKRRNLYLLLLARVYGRYRVLDAKIVGLGQAGEDKQSVRGFRTGGRKAEVDLVGSGQKRYRVSGAAVMGKV